MQRFKMNSWQPDFSKPTVLFGGAFDPPHLGHLRVAKVCQKALPQAQIVFLPYYQSTDKEKSLLSIELREKLLELSVKELEKTEKKSFFLWDYELKQESISYTIDSLKKAHSLGAKKDRLFFLLGSEQYRNFTKWKEGIHIRNFCRLIIAPRSPELKKQDSSDSILDMEILKLSSSEIRGMLEKSTIPKQALVPSVEQYLKTLLKKKQNPYQKV